MKGAQSCLQAFVLRSQVVPGLRSLYGQVYAFGRRAVQRAAMRLPGTRGVHLYEGTPGDAPLPGLSDIDFVLEIEPDLPSRQCRWLRAFWPDFLRLKRRFPFLAEARIMTRPELEALARHRLGAFESRKMRPLAGADDLPSPVPATPRDTEEYGLARAVELFREFVAPLPFDGRQDFVSRRFYRRVLGKILRLLPGRAEAEQDPGRGYFQALHALGGAAPPLAGDDREAPLPGMAPSAPCPLHEEACRQARPVAQALQHEFSWALRWVALHFAPLRNGFFTMVLFLRDGIDAEAGARLRRALCEAMRTHRDFFGNPALPHLPRPLLLTPAVFHRFLLEMPLEAYAFRAYGRALAGEDAPETPLPSRRTLLDRLDWHAARWPFVLRYVPRNLPALYPGLVEHTYRLGLAARVIREQGRVPTTRAHLEAALRDDGVLWREYEAFERAVADPAPDAWASYEARYGTILELLQEGVRNRS